MKNEMLTIEPIDVSKAMVATEETQALLVQVKAMLIKTQSQCQMASDVRNKAKDMLKALDKERKEMTIPLDNVKSQIMDKYRPAVECLNSVVLILNTGISAYITEQEQIQREKQRRLEIEAERRRQEAEAKAQEWAEKGNEKKSEEWQEKAENVVAPIVPDVTAEITGMSYRDDWDIEIIDVSLVPHDYCCPDEQMIRRFVKATKGTKPIAGVKIITKKIPISTRR